jgi:hypothetical protein
VRIMGVEAREEALDPAADMLRPVRNHGQALDLGRKRSATPLSTEALVGWARPVEPATPRPPARSCAGIGS